MVCDRGAVALVLAEPPVEAVERVTLQCCHHGAGQLAVVLEAEALEAAVGDDAVLVDAGLVLDGDQLESEVGVVGKEFEYLFDQLVCHLSLRDSSRRWSQHISCKSREGVQHTVDLEGVVAARLKELRGVASAGQANLATSASYGFFRCVEGASPLVERCKELSQDRIGLSVCKWFVLRRACWQQPLLDPLQDVEVGVVPGYHVVCDVCW